MIPKKVRITTTRFETNGSQFKNLIFDSEHEVVNPPNEYADNYPNCSNSVWVQGVGEPVRILSGSRGSNEFSIVEWA